MPHIRLLDRLAKETGLDRTSVIKLALYELGQKHGLKFEYGRHEKGELPGHL